MSFFRNSQIARQFKVSNTTVSNWIKASEKGANQLQLTTINGKKVIIDSQSNTDLIKKMIDRGRKHSSKKRLEIDPDPRLYEIFDSKQLAELYVSLSTKSEIPYKFTYLDKGAELWDKNYIIASSLEDYTAFKEAKFIEENIDKILSQFSVYNKVNIIDVGCGNGIPAIKIIRNLKNQIRVSYTAVDISKKMIDISHDNISAEFPDLELDHLVVDLDSENLASLLLDKKTDKKTANLILFLGGTLGNYAKDSLIFRTLRGSVSAGDFLLIGNEIGSQDLIIEPYSPNKYHFERTAWIPNLLGLEYLYSKNSINTYKKSEMTEVRKLTIQSDVQINFSYNNNTYPILFDQFDDVLVYKSSWWTELELIGEVVKHGFRIEQFTSNRNRTYALIMLTV